MVASRSHPLPTDGVVGHLTVEQERCLWGFWKEIARLIDSAPKEGTGASEQAPTAPAEKGPKDDKQKEKLRAEQETRDALSAFTEYGSVRFMASLWRFLAMDDPDAAALRFLRARKWSISGSVSMMCACIRWRMASDVEDIFRKGEEGMAGAEGFIRQMEMGKAYAQGTDRAGRPVMQVSYIHVAKHRTFDQSPKALEDYVLCQMESVRCLLGGAGVEKISMVFDMTGFGLRNMDWRCILFIVKCLEAYYPESLNVILIHSAPWLFQGIWKMLAPMLDPVVRAKVEMTTSTEDLVVHIPKHHLVKGLGGSSEWTWEYQAVIAGENALQKDNEGRRAAQKERDRLIGNFESASHAMLAAGPGESRALQKRRLAMLEMRAQYYLLDPYIRGRVAYHRHGNIVGNGLVFFEYPNATGAEAEAEWEVRGHSQCREQLLADAAIVRAELKASKVMH